VDGSPNLHNTGLFPDCNLLSITDGSIVIVFRQKFGDIQETQFSGSKMEVYVHLKNTFPGGIGNQRIAFGYNLWFASHPSPGPWSSDWSPQKKGFVRQKKWRHKKPQTKNQKLFCSLRRLFTYLCMRMSIKTTIMTTTNKKDTVTSKQHPYDRAGSIAGVLFDSVRRVRATLLLRTSCMRVCCN